MKHDEALIQCEIVKWLQEHGYFFFSCANEGAGGNRVRMMQLISMGLRAGAADMVVVLPEGRVLFVEVKAATGKQSEKQIKFQNRVEKLGHKYIIVKSVEDLACFFSDYKI